MKYKVIIAVFLVLFVFLSVNYIKDNQQKDQITLKDVNQTVQLNQTRSYQPYLRICYTQNTSHYAKNISACINGNFVK